MIKITTNTIKALRVVPILCLVACAQTKGTPHPRAEKANLKIPGSMEISEDCSRGRFDLELLNNHVDRDGKLSFFGRGHVTKAPVKTGKDAPKPEFINLGAEIEFNPASALISPDTKIAPNTLLNPRSRLQTLNLIPRSNGSDEPIAISMKRQKDNSYKADGRSDSAPLDLLPEQDASPGVRGVRALVAANNKLTSTISNLLAASVPAAVQTLDNALSTIGKEGKIKLGEKLTISIPNSNSEEGDFYTVRFEAKDGTWDAIYRAPGTSQTIEVPTKWDKGELKPGAVGLIVERSRMSVKELKDGKICVVSSAGVFTMLEIEK